MYLKKEGKSNCFIWVSSLASVFDYSKILPAGDCLAEFSVVSIVISTCESTTDLRPISATDFFFGVTIERMLFVVNMVNFLPLAVDLMLDKGLFSKKKILSY